MASTSYVDRHNQKKYEQGYLNGITDKVVQGNTNTEEKGYKSML